MRCCLTCLRLCMVLNGLKKNNQMERLQHFNVTLRVRAIFMRLFGSATFTATLKLVSLVGLR